jgi:hypothetical protein
MRETSAPKSWTANAIRGKHGREVKLLRPILRLGRLGWPLLAAAILCAGGCSRWNTLRDRIRGPGYTDQTANWSKGLRPGSSDSGQKFGVDQRAREIEANLGYR